MGIENETQNPYSKTDDVEVTETEKMNPEKIKPGVAIASLVLGILGLVLSCAFVGGILGIVGLILGIVVIAKKYSNKGMAIAGIITSAIACVATVVIVVFALYVFTDEDTLKILTNERNYLEDMTKDEEEHFWGTKYIAEDDDSTVYFYEDNTFKWYRDEENSDDMQTGTYEIYFGKDAEAYLESEKELADYDLNHDKIMESILSYTGEKTDLYRLKNLTVLRFNIESCVLDGEEALEKPVTIYYYGFSNEEVYHSANLNQGSCVVFTNAD